MEQSKTKVSYSIVRYIPDYLKGEVINIGLLMYNYSERTVRSFLLDDKSFKIKAILNNEVECDIYRTDKEILEYYLEKSKEDISGMVGKVYIASYHEKNFLNKMYEYYKDKNLILSEPNIAYTKNEEKLFDAILKKYVGDKYIETEKTSVLTAKKYMKKIFEDNANLKKRIKSDVIIKPILGMDDLEIKVDFSFKNGTWNYMQAIPRVIQHNKNLDWYSKVELMLNCDQAKGAKIHLLYKTSDVVHDRATYNLLVYLSKKYSNVDLHDVDKQKEVDKLCKYIEDEAEELVAV